MSSPIPKVVIVGRALIKDSEGNILLIKRRPGDNFCPSQWELPGGKMDVGMDLIRATELEILEETGLLITNLQKVVYLESHIEEVF